MMQIDILSGWQKCSECSSKFAGIFAIDSAILSEPLCYDCLQRAIWENENFEVEE
tara:strand:- start:68 stop:232 length:165 start_codon:yes stop_codon:yes gene_type:complete